VVFHALNTANLTTIVDIQLGRLARRLAARRLTLDVTDAAREWLAMNGFDPLYGARPLRRLIQSAIGDQLARALLSGEITDGDTVRVDLDDTTAAGTGALTVPRADPPGRAARVGGPTRAGPLERHSDPNRPPATSAQGHSDPNRPRSRVGCPLAPPCAILGSCELSHWMTPTQSAPSPTRSRQAAVQSPSSVLATSRWC
jgi:hypothetical protein